MDARNVLLLTEDCAYAGRIGEGPHDRAATNVHHYPVHVPALPERGEELEGIGRTLASQIGADFPDVDSWRLVIPMSWCLCQSVDMATARWGEPAAVFEFEPFVPVELESLTCVVQRIDSGRALVAAVFTDALRTLLQALEDSGICVEAVTTDAFVAAVACGSADADWRSFALIAHGRITTGTVAGVRLAVVRTMLLPPTGSADSIAPAAPPGWLSIGPCDAIRLFARSSEAALENAGQVMRTVEDVPSGVMRLLEAAGRATDLPDFRTGPLTRPGRTDQVRRRLRHCAVVLAVLLMVLGVRFEGAIAALESATVGLRPERDRLYAEVFPGEAAPASAAMRIRSERKKLEGMTDAKFTAENVHIAGLELLSLWSRIVARLPSDLRLNISELSLEQGVVRIAGRTRSHTEAGRLVQSMNAIEQLDAEPPRTKLLRDGTVDFRLSARWRSDDPDS